MSRPRFIRFYIGLENIKEETDMVRTFDKLSKDELDELRDAYCYDEETDVACGNADTVTDDMLRERYGNLVFTDDDFFCNQPDQQAEEGDTSLTPPCTGARCNEVRVEMQRAAAAARCPKKARESVEYMEEALEKADDWCLTVCPVSDGDVCASGNCPIYNAYQIIRQRLDMLKSPARVLR